MHHCRSVPPWHRFIRYLDNVLAVLVDFSNMYQVKLEDHLGRTTGTCRTVRCEQWAVILLGFQEGLLTVHHAKRSRV